MLFEPGEHEPDDYEPDDYEPDEYDPEAELTDPDADGITIPSVSTDETDVPVDLARTFWIVVVAVNAAVLALSLGALLLAFRADVTTGGGLLVGGVVLLALVVRRYRAFRDDTSERTDGVHSSDPGRDASIDGDGDKAETVSGSEPERDTPEEPPSHDENGT